MGRVFSSRGGDEDGDTTESEEDEKDEGFRLLLGGIEAGDVTCDAWENESVGKELSGGSSTTSIALDGGVGVSTGATTLCTITATGAAANEPFNRKSNKAAVLPVNCADGTATTDSLIFAWAHSCTDDRGSTRRPPVQVVEFEGRGRGLIATQRLSRGTVLFTERATLACQVPVDTDHGRPYSVRACQHCFRSLEPCLDGLPLPHLWPVSPPTTEGLVGPHGNRPLAVAAPDTGTTVVEDCGRVVCDSCDAWFCTQRCYNLHTQEQGSCCLCLQAARILPEFYGDRAVQSAVALAIRMFGNRLQQFRTAKSTHVTYIDGLCGLASDMTPLELGVEVDGVYTLEPLYNRLCALWSMTDSETQRLGLEYLHQLAAMAARNGVGMVPQSPFATYYNALLRACGGRGSETHESVKAQVAQALGSSDHRLQRGMDRHVKRRVAPEVVALFPLTAHVNHACRPNAEICSDFVDAHIDLQLLQDVEKGEEITISYIGYGRSVGYKNRDRRQLELQRKYLFHCACEACDPTS